MRESHKVCWLFCWDTAATNHMVCVYSDQFIVGNYIPWLSIGILGPFSTSASQITRCHIRDSTENVSPELAAYLGFMELRGGLQLLVWPPLYWFCWVSLSHCVKFLCFQTVLEKELEIKPTGGHMGPLAEVKTISFMCWLRPETELTEREYWTLLSKFICMSFKKITGMLCLVSQSVFPLNSPFGSTQRLLNWSQSGRFMPETKNRFCWIFFPQKNPPI